MNIPSSIYDKKIVVAHAKAMDMMCYSNPELITLESSTLAHRLCHQLLLRLSPFKL